LPLLHNEIARLDDHDIIGSVNKAQIVEEFRDHRVLFILRTRTPNHLSEMVATIWQAGGRFVEIAANTPDAFKVVSELRGMVPAGSYLGVGTICSVEQADRAVEAGGTFAVMPICCQSVVTRLRDRGLMTIVGASTPTEIFNARGTGADFVKVFPAQSPQYIRTVRGPFPDIPLVAVGGVTKSDAIKYLNAGCAGVAVGSSFFATHFRSDGSFDADEVKAEVRAIVRVCDLRMT
jgi:2-dehydro-3-deoxyphosphogluconate aldolase/(4S)-4-hydroxy-2-oxoglutarate aldolase